MTLIDLNIFMFLRGKNEMTEEITLMNKFYIILIFLIIRLKWKGIGKEHVKVFRKIFKY